MKKTSVIFLLCFLTALLLSAVDLKTTAEEKQYATYTTYNEMAAFLNRLQALDQRIRVQVVGRTLENAAEERVGRDLLCVVVSDPKRAGDKVLVQLQATPHGNEQSGVDAVQKLLAQIVAGKLDFLLERLDLVVFPQVNPYGNENNVRVNEQGLDMNRDHSKLETPGAEAMHRVFTALYPEVTFDMHEKGDAYFKINIGTVTNLNIDRRIEEYSYRVILPAVFKGVGATPACEYLIQTTMDDLPSSGAVPEGLTDPGEEIFRRSTTDINDGRNSFGIFNTLSFIQEISGNNDLDGYRDRSRWAFEGLSAFLRTVYDSSREIKALVAQCRADLLRKAKNRDVADPVHLRTIYARDPQQPVLKRKNYVKEDAGVIGIAARDIKAQEPVSRNDLQRPGRRPRVEEIEFKNWFPRVESLVTCARPLGYVIPASRRDVIILLQKLGVRIYCFDRGGMLAVEACRVDDIIQGTGDYIPPQRITVTFSPLQLPVSRGDFHVPLDQPAANLVPLLLEPQSDLGLIRFRSFDLGLEKGDIFPIYRVLQAPKIPYMPLSDFRALPASYLGLKPRI
ncbi:MAG: DUF2817 domain-containing protein [Acidobacteria bacterium]|nr:DUF2817 domain-containing protein [Acidobacteriota bacterium]